MTDVIIKEEKVKEEEDDASSETLPLSLSLPNLLIVTSDIVIDVEAETVEEENTDKDDSAALETL